MKYLNEKKIIKQKEHFLYEIDLWDEHYAYPRKLKYIDYPMRKIYLANEKEKYWYWLPIMPIRQRRRLRKINDMH